MADKNIFKLEGKSQEQVKEAFLEFLKIDKTKPGGYASDICEYELFPYLREICFDDEDKYELICNKLKFRNATENSN